MRSNRGARAARMVALVVTLAAAAAAPSAPVAARERPTALGAPEGRLWLSVVRGEDADGPDREWAVLTCSPDGGTHPHAETACDTLRSVDGRITTLPADERFCVKNYAPVIAEAMGEWRGRQVHYRALFPNRCVLEAEAGPIFHLARH
ncbi:SSI family serine proteinase inhibitor [Wenjunlia tyrosinilytica]|uniref:Subtilisin inhibitor domain-containing protein n=1 Tax=Wenjunlia tyrosinilytica TaxID=1544741 RepID=A0A917ZJA4_9ACTN|nr:SSI family serine proteinase inhibitor [Wenjunlia tyrosinilytica]GGO84486.1 hypothetical protein GCM10012280_16080 [Wenjunlia tyrosinilytica]